MRADIVFLLLVVNCEIQGLPTFQIFPKNVLETETVFQYAYTIYCLQRRT